MNAANFSISSLFQLIVLKIEKNKPNKNSKVKKDRHELLKYFISSYINFRVLEIL